MLLIPWRKGSAHRKDCFVPLKADEVASGALWLEVAHREDGPLPKHTKLAVDIAKLNLKHGRKAITADLLTGAALRVFNRVTMVVALCCKADAPPTCVPNKEFE